MSLQKILQSARIKLFSDPYTKGIMISQMCESATKRIINLRAVDHFEEAVKVTTETRDELVKYWKSDFQNPLYIHAIMSLYKETEDFDSGIDIIKIFVESLSGATLDLTTCYLDLGKLYSLRGGSPLEELECYIKAYQSVGPEDGKFPATRKDKAECCYRIYKLAEWLKHEKLSKKYKDKCEELSFGVKLNYAFAANDFFADRSGEPTPEAIARVNALLEGQEILEL